MVGKTNAGGGAAGATLVITGVVGHSVTASNGSKTYTRTIDSTGKAVIKGLSTGTWTLTMTGDGQIATRTVDVNADYAITIAYFSATIAVTYPEGSTCTCSDGTTTLTAVGTTGSYTFTVPNTGTWTVTATDGSSTASQAVSITAEGQSESVTLRYALVLFDNGTYASETGGFTGISNSKLYTTNTGHQGDYTYTPWYSKNAVDITKYSTLKFTVEKGGVTGDASNYNLLDVGITKTKGTTDTSKLAAKVRVRDSSATTDKTYTLDISSFSGTYYVEGISQGGDWSSEVKITYSNTLRVELS